MHLSQRGGYHWEVWLYTFKLKQFLWSVVWNISNINRSVVINISVLYLRVIYIMFEKSMCYIDMKTIYNFLICIMEENYIQTKIINENLSKRYIICKMKKKYTSDSFVMILAFSCLNSFNFHSPSFLFIFDFQL